MGIIRRMQRGMLTAYADAPTAVQVKSRVLLLLTVLIVAIQIANLFIVQIALQRSLAGAAASLALLLLFAVDLWLLRRGSFRAASSLSMVLVYATLTAVGLTTTSPGALLTAGKMAVLLAALVVYTTLVGDRVWQPIVATVASIGTVLVAYSTRASADTAVPSPLETGWLINYCWVLGFLGVLSVLSSLIYERSVRRAEEKAAEALEHATEVRRGATERRKLEERLHQSEKLEAIGQLAGGVAHDFNNQLVCILGYGELIQQSDASDGVQAHAASIIAAAERSAELTQQLLAFARKGPLQDEPFDLHGTIDQVTKVLQRSIDKRITILSDLGAPSPTVRGDASRLHHGLLNIALNARDAMPEGGILTFRTATVEVGSAKEGPGDLEPGPYVQIDVSDTGAGIGDEDMAHIFEPFFTTKAPGQGTGLGLAAVLGTIQSHHGDITCHSALGEGTTFGIRLPLCESEQEPSQASSTDVEDDGAGRRVLVIDDDPAVRRIAAALLDQLGHEVVQAGGAEEGVATFREAPGQVHLVLLDLVMPDRSGADVFRDLQAINPDVRVVLASGYGPFDEVQAVLDAGGRGFLQKPYGLGELKRAVEAALRD